MKSGDGGDLHPLCLAFESDGNSPSADCPDARRRPGHSENIVHTCRDRWATGRRRSADVLNFLREKRALLAANQQSGIVHAGNFRGVARRGELKRRGGCPGTIAKEDVSNVVHVRMVDQEHV